MPGVWSGVRWAMAPGAAGGGTSRARLVWRAASGALVHGRQLRRWLALVSELHARKIVASVPAEYLRAVRPSANRGTSISQRVVQLTDHVDWLEGAFTPEAFATLVSGQPLTIGELAPPRGYESMRLQLRQAPARSSEGEMLLVLVLQRSPDIQHGPVPMEACVLAFSRFRIDGAACLVIGGVKGQRNPNQRVSTAELNQGLQGWKPSVFLVRVAQELARHWNLNLVGLDPASHRLHGWTYRWNSRHRASGEKIFESYRSLWDHFSATNGPKGWVILPLHADEKLAATALSPEKRERQSRRADYWIRTRNLLRTRFRQVMQRPTLDEMAGGITQAMDSSIMPGRREDEEPDLDAVADGAPSMPSRSLDTGPVNLI